MAWIPLPKDKFKELLTEVEMALGFLRAFLNDDLDGDFSDLYEDVCDSYSALVDAQMNRWFLITLLENMERKINA